jgi:hypothetical protein
MKILTKQRLKYFQCGSCNFWLTSQDYYCPNCKAPVPSPSASLALKFTLFLSSVPAIHIVFQSLGPDFNSYKLAFALIASSVSFLSVFTAARFSLKELFALEILPQKLSSSLCDDEEKIQQRLKEFQDQAKPILTAKERAQKINDSYRRSTIEATLNQAMTILRGHHDRYQAKRWEIQLIRWHNELKPVLAHWYEQVQSGPELLYQELDTAREHGENLLNEWLKSDLADTPEGSQHIEKLRDALASCDLLYQDLVTRQAAAAVQGISRFMIDPRSGQATQVAKEQLALLNALPDVTNFSMGLEDLEAEYLRFQSEEELANSLDSPALYLEGQGGDQKLGNLEL